MAFPLLSVTHRAAMLVLRPVLMVGQSLRAGWRAGPFRLVRYTIERLLQQRCTQVASSLTFTSMLAMIPLLSIVLTILGLFPVGDGSGTALQHLILSNLAPDDEGVREVVLDRINEFTQNTKHLKTIGLISLALTSLLTLTTIDNVFNRLWGVARRRPLGQRFLLYWSLLTMGPVLLGTGAYVSSALVAAAMGWNLMPAWVTHTWLSVSSTLLNIVGFTMLYWIVPNRPVRFKHAAIGGVVAGLIFEAMKHGFSVYVTHMPTYTVLYGAMAVLPVFLVGVYLSWWVILIGAAMTSVLPDLHGRREDQVGAGRAWPVSLGILVALRDAQEKGQGLVLDEIAPKVGIGFAETEEWLESLADRGWVAHASNGRWYLALNPRNLRLRTVYDKVVLAPSNDVVGISAGVNPVLDQSLFDLDVNAPASREEALPVGVPPTAEEAIVELLSGDKDASS